MSAPMANIAYGRVEGVAVMVAGKLNPSDVEWDRYIDFLEAMRTPGPSARTLAVTEGGAPSSAQRVRLERRIGEHRRGSKLAVVTGSTFARGVLNAWALVRPGYRAFAPADLDEALRFLDIPMAIEPGVRALVRQLRAALDATA
jgi:hypothetical protein